MEKSGRESFWRFEEGKIEDIEDDLISEQSLDILINGTFIKRLKCLPGEAQNIAAGYLCSSGFLTDRNEIRSIEVSDNADTVNIEAHVDPARLAMALKQVEIQAGSKGIDKFIEFEKTCNLQREINTLFKLSGQNIVNLFNEFKKKSDLYKNVGGVHSGGLSKGTTLDYFAEDLGRHNAIDRVIGEAFLCSDSVSSMILLTTGRLHLDTVNKAARMRIPIIVSRSAPTISAVELCEKYHVTLCGRVRSGSMAIYSEPWRITDFRP